MKKNEENEKDLRVVLYCDGSAVPNPGTTGGGIHGYMYDYNDNSNKTEFKPSRYVITNTGYKDLDSAVNYIKLPDEVKVSFKTSKDVKVNIPFRNKFNTNMFSFVVNPTCYIEGIVNLRHATNNVGELKAAIDSIKFILELSKEEKINSLLIYTDSSYVVNACQQTKVAVSFNDTYTANANKDYLVELNKAYYAAMDANLSIEVKWVKGHASNIGNIKADMLADIGRKSKELNISVIKKYAPKDYYKSISLDSSITDNMDKLIYSNLINNKITLHKQEYSVFAGLKSKISKNPGKGITPTSYVYVLKNTKNNELLDISNSLRDSFFNQEENDTDYSLILYLKELTQGDTYYYIDKYGIDNVVEFTRDKARLIGDEEHHNTLAKMTLHSSSSTYGSNRDSLLNNIVLDIKYDIRNIEKYIASNDSSLISITNYFYANNKLILNGKTEEISFANNENFAKIRIGVDTPELNVLSKMAKKVEHVLLQGLEHGGFQIIFVCKDEFVIYHNPMNILFVGHGEYHVNLEALKNKDVAKKKKK